MRKIKNLVIITFICSSVNVFSVYNPLAHGLDRNPNEICLSNLKDVVVEPFVAINETTPNDLVQKRINIRFKADSKFDKYFEFPEDGPIDFPFNPSIVKINTSDTSKFLIAFRFDCALRHPQFIQAYTGLFEASHDFSSFSKVQRLYVKSFIPWNQKRETKKNIHYPNLENQTHSVEAEDLRLFRFKNKIWAYYNDMPDGFTISKATEKITIKFTRTPPKEIDQLKPTILYLNKKWYSLSKDYAGKLFNIELNPKATKSIFNKLISLKNGTYQITPEEADQLESSGAKPLPRFKSFWNKRRMYLSELEKNKNGLWEISGHPIKLLPEKKDQNSGPEKNWMPINIKNQLFFSRFVNPHTIIGPVTETNKGSIQQLKTKLKSCSIGKWNTKKWGNIRGGTNWIAINENEYLTFVHVVRKVVDSSNGRGNYWMAAIKIRANDACITGISKNPIEYKGIYTSRKGYWAAIQNLDVVFPMTQVKANNDQIIVSAGNNDGSIDFIFLDKKSLLETLVHPNYFSGNVPALPKKNYEKPPKLLKPSFPFTLLLFLILPLIFLGLLLFFFTNRR